MVKGENEIREMLQSFALNSKHIQSFALNSKMQMESKALALESLTTGNNIV
ncbi:hypothetical protein BGP_4254 [Beggiatoa sp. PS]|nr:hypothetical protein BGP_4254 [Beggiatoa sp. PS]